MSDQLDPMRLEPVQTDNRPRAEDGEPTDESHQNNEPRSDLVPE